MSQTGNNANAYHRTRVLTASQEQLRLMLLDGAIKFLRQGRDGLVAKDFEADYTGFTRCRDILLELASAMRFDMDPDLCKRVASVYMFIYQLTIDASFEKDITKADEAARLLDYERETWVLAMAKIAKERAEAAGGVSQTPTPAEPTSVAVEGAQRAYQPLSVQG